MSLYRVIINFVQLNERDSQQCFTVQFRDFQKQDTRVISLDVTCIDNREGDVFQSFTKAMS